MKYQENWIYAFGLTHKEFVAMCTMCVCVGETLPKGDRYMYAFAFILKVHRYRENVRQSGTETGCFMYFQKVMS